MGTGFEVKCVLRWAAKQALEEIHREQYSWVRHSG